MTFFSLQSLAQWDESVQALRTAGTLLPARSAMLPEFYNRLGIALLKQGWAQNILEPVQEAASVLREGRSRYPKNREILANLAEVRPNPMRLINTHHLYDISLTFMCTTGKSPLWQFY